MAARLDGEGGEYHRLRDPEAQESQQPPERRRQILLPLFVVVVVLALATAVFFLWPRSPDVKLKSVEFQGIKLDRKDSSVLLYVKLNVTVSVKNRNFFAIRYRRIRALIDYRGDELGQVDSARGRLAARSVADATAMLKLEGLEILSDAPQLIADAARERLPLTVKIFFDGNVVIWFVKPHVKASSKCNLVVNPSNNKVEKSDCDLVNAGLARSNHLSFKLPTKFSPTVWYMIVLYVVAGLLVLALIVRILWPLPPDVDFEGLELLGISANTQFVENSVVPDVILDINVRPTFKVRNRNFFGATYDSVRVYVYYYDYELAQGEFLGGHVKPRETSHIDGVINVRGIEVAWNATQLLQDYAKGKLPLSVTVEFSGNVGILYCYKPHIQVALQYNVVVNPSTQEVIEQSPKLK